MDDSTKRKVFSFLDECNLITTLQDFSKFPQDILNLLQKSNPDYPTYDQFKQSTINKQFDSFDDFIQSIYDYLNVIPNLLLKEDRFDIRIFKSVIQEILCHFDRKIKKMIPKENCINQRNFINKTGQQIEFQEIQEFIEKRKELQIKILEFLDDLSDIEEKYQNILEILEKQQIRENKYNIIDFLHLISKISKHHKHSQNFFNKIETLLSLIKDEIKKYFTSDHLFNIFKENKRIILYFINEKIINFEDISKKISKINQSEYKKYFYKEFQSLHYIKDKLPENFEYKRDVGETDTLLTQIIKKDSIESFIIYCEKKWHFIEFNN